MGIEVPSGVAQLMPIYTQHSERETTIADAQSSIGKSAEERAAQFTGLLETMESMLNHLTPEERKRRREAARYLDPRPEPWWKNLRISARSDNDGATY